MIKFVKVRILFSAVGCLLAFAGTLTAEHASAGDFSVKQCAGAGYAGFFGTYGQLGTVDRVDVVYGCSNSGANKIGVYQNRGGSGIPFGIGGQFLWDPPFGVDVYGTAITAKLHNVNGVEAAIVGASSSWPNADLDQGAAHDGLSRTMSWTSRAQPLGLVIAKLSCQAQSGCSNLPDGPKAYFEITDAEFKSTDSSNPTLTPSGSLWDLGATWQWHRGNVGFQVSAQDVGAGITRSYLLINNLQLDLPAIGCPGDRTTFATSFTPCPASVIRSGTADTSMAPFQEGSNLVQFCTEDYASVPAESNRTCSATRFAFIDNVAPGPPLELSTVGGTDWRSENGFEVEWRNPDGQRSAITEADFRLTRALDGSLIDSGTVAVGADPGIGPLTLPGAGEYRVEVKLRDGAGNTGTGASTTLRFDDGRPEDVAPEPLSGWVSADEFPLEQPIEKAEAGGPSGVEGYAVEVSRQAPVSPCPTGECSAQDLTLASGADMRTAMIPNLSEGSHWISAVASSGASLASQQVGSALVKVDKTVPEVSLDGAPAGWVNQPVTLTAVATDSGSGMEGMPGVDDGQPVTVIRAGDEAPYAAPGARATFTVASEGVTSVAYWARDLAGNTNDGAFLPDGGFHPRPGQATVRIDRIRPSVTVRSTPDPEDPELVTAKASDSDSGIRGGTIFIRKAQGGQFQELETSVEDDLLTARVPSDQLAAGKYELQARAGDRAGNTGTSANTYLTMPLKLPTELSVRFTRRKAALRAARLKHGKAIEVSGSLTRRGGQAIAGVRIILEQSFAAGSQRTVVLTETRTDGTGRYAAALKAGPSRLIRVRFEGSRTAQPANSRDLKLVVRDRISFRISPKVMRNGGKALMKGSIKGRGALRPARGKLIAIQYFDPSRGKWRPVEVLRARKNGQFRYEYRFRTIAYAQRILFRATSLPESGWPFKPSTSRRQSVIVYPKG